MEMQNKWKGEITNLETDRLSWVIKREILERVNAHRQFLYVIKKLPAPFMNREIVNSMTWKLLPDNSVIFCAVPCDHPNKLEKRGDNVVVELLSSRFFRLTPINGNCTKVEYITTIGLGGYVPMSFITSFAVPQFINPVSSLQFYFQALISLEDCDEEDGSKMGFMLMDELFNSKLDRKTTINIFCMKISPSKYKG